MKKIPLLLFIILASITAESLYAQGNKLKITIGGSEFTATLNTNETVDAFVALLPMTVNMNEMGGYEKYHYLPGNLPGVASNPGTTHEGDLMIWSSNCLVLFYTTRSTSYSYVKLGRIDNTSGLREAVGNGNVQVTFALEGDDPTANESIAEEKGKQEVRKYESHIEVTGNVNKLTLYSLTGKIAARSESYMIATGNIPRGVYLLKIDSTDGNTITRKIIIH